MSDSFSDASGKSKWLSIGEVPGDAYPVRGIFWTSGVLVSAFLTWSARHGFSVDGLSYLDIAEAYRRHDWQSAINAYWSPLYSWILALGLSVLKPSSHWLFPAVQLINFLISLVAMWCFEYFWRFRGARQVEDACESPAPHFVGFPRWAWQVLGYSLFIWTITQAIPSSEVGADLLVASIVFLACGLVVRIRAGHIGLVRFLFLGLVLGLGYLAKAVIFPLAFVFLGVALFAPGKPQRASARILAALIVFLVVSAPFITAISRSKGRFTTGDTGKINYAWGVNRSAPFFNWQGDGSAAGTPRHPTRKLHSEPALYEFATPISGTYPPHYDPSYWNEGLTPHFNLRQQVRALVTGLYACYQVFLLPQSAVVAGAIILFLMGGRASGNVSRLGRNWHLWIPAFAGLGVYVLITVTPRNVAAFFLVLWMAILSAIRLPDTREFKRLLTCVTISSALLLFLSIGESLGTRIYEWSDRSTDRYWQVADSLVHLGIHPGDKVASLGSAYNAYWARLAQAKIVAEIPSSDVGIFWAADPQVKSEVFAACAKIGIRAIVTRETPGLVSGAEWQKVGSFQHNVLLGSDWQKLGSTGYYVHVLLPTEVLRAN